MSIAHKAYIVLLSCCVSLFAACSGDSSSNDDDKKNASSDGVPVPFTVLVEGRHPIASSGAKTTRVISSALEMNTVAQQYGVALPPTVDFASQRLVLIDIGKQSSGGHAVFIETALGSSSTTTVKFVATKPGQSCVLTQAEEQPFLIAVLPKSENVAFSETEKVVECNAGLLPSTVLAKGRLEAVDQGGSTPTAQLIASAAELNEKAAQFGVSIGQSIDFAAQQVALIDLKAQAKGGELTVGPVSVGDGKATVKLTYGGPAPDCLAPTENERLYVFALLPTKAEVSFVFDELAHTTVCPGPFTVLAQGRYPKNTGDGTKTTRVLSTAAELDGVAQEYGVTIQQTVNFETHRVVLIDLGTYPNGGYGLALSGLTKNGTTSTVEYTATSSGSNCASTQALVRPFAIAAIAKNDTILFKETSHVESCSG